MDPSTSLWTNKALSCEGLSGLLSSESSFDRSFSFTTSALADSRTSRELLVLVVAVPVVLLLLLDAAAKWPRLRVPLVLVPTEEKRRE